MTPARLCVALDTADPAQASRLVALLRPHVDLFKIGLEFFAAHGPAGVAALGAGRVFLDLKLHDIPATVAGATRAVGGLHPAMLTVMPPVARRWWRRRGRHSAMRKAGRGSWP